MYAAAGEKVQPPTITNQPSISEFEEYINKMEKSYKKYMKFHKKEEAANNEHKTIKKADAISAVNKVPEEYFKEDFKIESDFFKFKKNKEVTARNALLSEYLEDVENFLIAHVADNFDYFSRSFDNIRDMEVEMGEIKDEI